MSYRYSKNKLIKGLSIILSFVLTMSYPLCVSSATEAPEFIYNGSTNYSTMLKNLDYTDVKNSDTWAKEAIYESGALDIMKGYGDKLFGRTAPVSKEQAIAIAYRIVGREADAQKLGEALDNAKIAANKKADALSVWSDGYLQLAATEGLITPQELRDAFTQDQTTLTEPTIFHRDAPAQRQEMANWIAKTLKLAPAYGQQKLFNSYNDWKLADPIKVPYIETVLQNNIMNGMGGGNFLPTGEITREQVSQIIKNAEAYAFVQLKLEKKSGTIENIIRTGDSSLGENISRYTINIRNTNGKLHQIVNEFDDKLRDPNKNELNGGLLNGLDKDTVVYKNGQIGTSQLLRSTDKIDYIIAPDKSIKFINVVSSADDTKYIAAQINGIDSKNSLIDVTELFGLSSEDMNSAISFDVGSPKANAIYRISSNVKVLINGVESDIKQINPGMNVLLTVRAGTIIKIKDVVYKDQGVIKGIIEDNNPNLGYLTLFNENGSGVSPDAQAQLALFRTYNYLNPNDIEIYKNHEKAKIEDIEPGDTAFVKIDGNGIIYAISAMDNYIPKYGRVLSVKPKVLTVQYDDGTQQVLDIDDNALVIYDKKIVSFSRLKDGDRVKLLMHETNNFTKIKEITIEGDEHYIANVYKGIVNYVDDTSSTLIVQDLMTLDKGQWIRVAQKGVTDIKLSTEYDMYAGNKKTNISNANKYLRNNEAYIAVEKDYGGNERAVLIAFRNEDDTETLYDDTVASSAPGSGEISLSRGYDNLKYSDSTIVIKDGRLVTGNSITDGNLAYFVANRNYDDGDIYAGIVQIGDRSKSDFIQIYRARIKQIEDSKGFTVESFSQLNGLKWEYKNTEKTFKITSGTRILDDAGVIGQREFIDYGDNNYKGKTVYVLSSDVNADLISTVSYGVYNIKGEIYEITGGSIGVEGTIMSEPTAFKVKNTKTYDLNDFEWNNSNNMSLNILKNSIILKNNKIAKASDLKKGDKVRIIKKDGKETGDAYIILVEE